MYHTLDTIEATKRKTYRIFIKPVQVRTSYLVVC